MTLALQGIRVLDITDAISGPFTTMLLAGCGAEVIRVESRRHLGFRTGVAPGMRETPESQMDFSKIDMSTLVGTNFHRYNRDKMSIALNLTRPGALDVFKKLVRVSDVVIDNLSFGVVSKWGVTYEALKQVKEDIIVVNMPSLGTGPHQEWTTWGMNLLSFTGFAYTWGHPDTPVEERVASNTYIDYIASMHTLAAVLSALYYRSKTGKGQRIEVAQTEAGASLLGTLYMDYLVNGRDAQPIGNRHPQFAPYNSYRCKDDDRWCVIAVSNEDEWNRFRRTIGSPKWAEDPKFQDMASRVKNVDELDANIEKWTRQYTPRQVMKILQSNGVVAGAVQNSEEIFYDLQLRARNHVVEMDIGQQQGHVSFDGPPLYLAHGQKIASDPAPVLGAQNDYVYKQLLGMTQPEIDRLTEEKVIF